MYYAYHGWDLMTFFGSVVDYIDAPANSDIVLQQTIRDAIFEFTKHGNITDWRLYPASTNILGDETTHQEQYNKEKCDFWIANDLCQKYKWVNQYRIGLW